MSTSAASDGVAGRPYGSVPALFARMVDDGALLPPGTATATEVLTGHRAHRSAWYADLVGPLLAPPSEIDSLQVAIGETEPPTIGLVGELPAVRQRLAKVDAGGGSDFVLARVEVPVAKRGEDPMPGVSALVSLAQARPDLDVYAEIPLTWGLLGALDALAEAGAAGTAIRPKFRTGGLASELFPTPVELAAVICACRDRNLPFKVTAGLHHAIRHGDPETGFTHHGFLNVLVGSILADDGAEVVEVAEALGSTDPVPLIETVRPRRGMTRPLWLGFASPRVVDPVADLIQLSLL